MDSLYARYAFFLLTPGHVKEIYGTDLAAFKDELVVVERRAGSVSPAEWCAGSERRDAGKRADGKLLDGVT